ncbi:zinc transporter ZupT [Corynebacterium epidermidicanis]|uniref:Zinc transporter ZupT n=1 Tax=Corynebacterium epidermidicanis TaxID=1050174 RepID=A0A0G3GTC5_9CORY|nr:zinc transporter ZupT [Corynebacterium epidermidicanis]AKK02783.1 putative divalent heavy-metal cations transporter [Corynebacterium epidermidicanis]
MILAFALTLAAGLSTAIGGLVVLKRREPTQLFLAAALGFSAGVMLWVSFLEIMPEATANLQESFGEKRGAWAATGAFFAGVLLIGIIDRLVPEPVNPHETHVGDGQDLSAQAFSKMGLMMALAIGIHNFPEGFATFLSGMNSLQVALPVAIAIGIHNIPEGISVAIPLWQATGSRWKGFKWAAITGLAEPLGALVGYLVLLPFLGPTTMGIAFGMIAGIMVFISLDELLPTAEATGKHHAAVYGLVVGMAVMALSLLLFL